MKLSIDLNVTFEKCQDHTKNTDYVDYYQVLINGNPIGRVMMKKGVRHFRGPNECFSRPFTRRVAYQSPFASIDEVMRDGNVVQQMTSKAISSYLRPLYPSDKIPSDFVVIA